jgi:tRNA pseudouridine13 synthase
MNFSMARADLSDADLLRVLDPPLATADLPGIGGSLRLRPDDFQVVEIPAYAPDGREGDHLLLVMRKVGWNTDDAVAEIARQLGLRPGSVGVAGKKDRDALTEQWISLPWEARGQLETFHHPDIRLGPAHPHHNKLRRGHLHGNRFEIVVRDLATGIAESRARASRKVEALERQGGLWNLFGEQRFGRGGANLGRGFGLLRRGRFGRRDHFPLSAAQSALFNLYLLERAGNGSLRRVLLGDVLQKTDSGGLFESHDPEIDQARLDRGEVRITGPIFGSRTLAPTAGTPAAELESSILDRAGIEADTLRGLGKNAPGSRRPLQVSPGAVEIAEVPALETPPLSVGLQLRFSLPPGGYATVLLREMQGGGSPLPAQEAQSSGAGTDPERTAT